MTERGIATCPQELLDNILGYLVGARSLPNCSLVCSSWRYSSQRHLFYQVAFHTKEIGDDGPEKFNDFLKHSPHIAPHIRHLTLTPGKGRHSVSVQLSLLDSILSCLPNLRILWIVGVVILAHHPPVAVIGRYTIGELLLAHTRVPFENQIDPEVWETHRLLVLFSLFTDIQTLNIIAAQQDTLGDDKDIDDVVHRLCISPLNIPSIIISKATVIPWLRILSTMVVAETLVSLNLDLSHFDVGQAGALDRFLLQCGSHIKSLTLRVTFFKIDGELRRTYPSGFPVSRCKQLRSVQIKMSNFNHERAFSSACAFILNNAPASLHQVVFDLHLHSHESLEAWSYRGQVDWHGLSRLLTNIEAIVFQIGVSDPDRTDVLRRTLEGEIRAGLGERLYSRVTLRFGLYSY